MAKKSKAQDQSWPASKVEIWPLAKLKPYENNPRTHSQDQIGLLARSMADDGVTTPMLVDEKGVIIAGHGRLLAAQANGFDRYPVVVARGWTEDQKRAVRIKDNSIALLAGWDQELMRLEAGELRLHGYDMPLLGFDEAALAGFLDTNPGQADPDEAPPVPAKPVTKSGDLWHLGRHRLLCGDATKAEDVTRLLAGKKPHLMVTDPPYGVDYDPQWRDRATRAGVPSMQTRPLKFSSLGRVTGDQTVDWNVAWRLFDGDVVYVWHAGILGAETAVHLRGAGFVIRSQIIWAKQVHVLGRSDYHWKHEACWYGVRSGRTSHWASDRKQSTVWDINTTVGFYTPKDQTKTIHSTQKPIECMKRPIENNSQAGDWVYDPFVGSGTTMVAAEMTGRKCLAIEIDPSYCDVAIERWQSFSGKQATMDGQSFEQIKRSRHGKSPKRPKPAKRSKPRATMAAAE